MENDETGFREMIDRMCAEFVYQLNGTPRQSWYGMEAEQRVSVRRAMFAAYLTIERHNQEKELVPPQ